MNKTDKEILKEVWEYGKEWGEEHFDQFDNLDKERFSVVINRAISITRQEEREKLKEQFDEEKAFPKDIFPELTDKQLADIQVLLNNGLGFTLDRLSAHIGRKHYKNIKQELKNE